MVDSKNLTNDISEKPKQKETAGQIENDIIPAKDKNPDDLEIIE